MTAQLYAITKYNLLTLSPLSLIYPLLSQQPNQFQREVLHPPLNLLLTLVSRTSEYMDFYWKKPSLLFDLKSIWQGQIWRLNWPLTMSTFEYSKCEIFILKSITQNTDFFFTCWVVEILDIGEQGGTYWLSTRQ